MAFENNYIQNFEVRNEDVHVKFSCTNHRKRIKACIDNLCIDIEDEDSLKQKQAVFRSDDEKVEMRFAHYSDPNEGWIQECNEIKRDAFFFENTDYPVRVIARHPGVHLTRITIGKGENDGVIADDDMIFGTVNYHNQVGYTNIKVHYLTAEGESKSLSFTTEVLSYKMNYRSDMRQVIADIEEEFSMLSYSLLKETYLTFQKSQNESPDLIWWQIFRDCFNQIVEATNLIINRPIQRLKSTVRYERAEQLAYITPEQENEYEEHKNEPNYLYRMEEMYLSKDTLENRFLKYAIHNIQDRFHRVKNNILFILNADNISMLSQLNEMNEELDRLSNHPFFRGIGNFKGLNQDSLVLKQARGYRDVYQKWIELQCGYDLEEGIMQLEVKDISELYEIWCFIKVKNIVEHILRDKAKAYTTGRELDGNFIKQLVYGQKSEVKFIENNNGIELASVMYNATTDDEAAADFDPTSENPRTDIEETTSKTTEQRPDIVLRLQKNGDNIQYTYLFDAKYRISDSSIPSQGGVDVPPVGAINQMHRYRDAIYYTKSSDNKLKREVIGGYVLYPGNLSKNQFTDSYYYNSIDEVNIGAFPLKPGGHWNSKDEELLLDPNSSEDVLYEKIKKWLKDDRHRETLIRESIPQKGLNYSIEEVKDALYFIAAPDPQVNDNIPQIIEGNANEVLSGWASFENNNYDLQSIKYYVPINQRQVHGYYTIKSIKIINLGNRVNKPLRARFEFVPNSYIKLKNIKPFGRDSEILKGIALSREEFYKFFLED